MATYGVILVVGLMVVLNCMSFGSAKVYTVGDSAGWALSVNYATWASDKTFNVGDSLVFNYDSSHTVDVVSSGDYAACTAGNSIASYNSGTTTISLNTTGPHYFICGAMGHCTGGMKLKITVATDGSPSAAPTPSPVTADSPTTTTTTTTPLGTALTPPSVAGASNVPVESSSPAVVSPVVAAAVLCVVALMWDMIIS